MKKILFLPACLVLFLFSFESFSQNPLDSKLQLWNEVQLIVPVKHGKDSNDKKIDKITATFSGILRLGRKNWDFVDNRYGVTLDFRVNKYFGLMSSVLYRKD